MYNASVAIQVLPQVEGEKLIQVVDEVIAYIKSKGLSCLVGPFETTIEGDYDTLMEIVKECQLIINPVRFGILFNLFALLAYFLNILGIY